MAGSGLERAESRRGAPGSLAVEPRANGGSKSAPWERLLADAAPSDHIVQLYQDDEFLNYAVCYFAAAGLANGESVILFPTLAHWDAMRPRLEAEGVDVRGAEKRGQLTMVDANELLPSFLRNDMPDPGVFEDAVGDIIGEARAGGRYKTVRLWGEMVDVLWERGDVTASMSLEDLFDDLGRRREFSIFCSFLMDNFNGDVQAHMLPRLGTNHSHLIPVADYDRLERAVTDALWATVGPDEASVLKSQMLSRYQPPFNMPPAQALLLALRQFLPTVADPVLQLSRELYALSGPRDDDAERSAH
jgi:hypothetical protein